MIGIELTGLSVRSEEDAPMADVESELSSSEQEEEGEPLADATSTSPLSEAEEEVDSSESEEEPMVDVESQGPSSQPEEEGEPITDVESTGSSSEGEEEVDAMDVDGESPTQPALRRSERNKANMPISYPVDTAPSSKGKRGRVPNDKIVSAVSSNLINLIIYLLTPRCSASCPASFVWQDEWGLKRQDCPRRE